MRSRFRSDASLSTSRREFLKCSVRAGVSLGVVPTPYLIGAGSQVAVPKARALPRWQAHPVAEIPHGYQVAVADVNGDGFMDILALGSGESIVAWYENPNWKARSITTETQRNVSLAPLSQPGLGFRGLALASDFSLEDNTRGGSIWWLEPPAFRTGTMEGRASRSESSPSVEAGWTRYLIAKIPTSHRLRWADVDGDGHPELVDAPIVGSGAKPPNYAAGARITWFEVPDAVLNTRPREGRRQAVWSSHLIDDTLTVVHGISVIDWDGDGRDELLTASFEGIHLLRSTGRGTAMRWTKTQLAAGDQTSKSPGASDRGSAVHRGSSEISVGSLGGRRFLATIEPWHGEQVVAYFENGRRPPDQLWERRVIDASLRNGHALACADLDGDGNDEIVAGFRGPGTSLYAYFAADSSGRDWKRQPLDTEIAASGVAISDLNGDGRLDVVAIGGSTGNLKWYENLG